MKYLFTLLTSFFAVIILAAPAWAMEGGGKDKGVQLDLAVFANQSSQNNSGTSVTTTTVETDGHVGLGYALGHLYLGGAAYFGVVDTLNPSGVKNTEVKSTINWLAPMVGYLNNNFRILGGYVVSATDALATTASGATSTINLSSGTGYCAAVSYTFFVSSHVYIAPLVDYYDITFTSGNTPTNKNYEITGLAPFLTLGFDF